MTYASVFHFPNSQNIGANELLRLVLIDQKKKRLQLGSLNSYQINGEKKLPQIGFQYHH